MTVAKNEKSNGQLFKADYPKWISAVLGVVIVLCSVVVAFAHLGQQVEYNCARIKSNERAIENLNERIVGKELYIRDQNRMEKILEEIKKDQKLILEKLYNK